MVGHANVDTLNNLFCMGYVDVLMSCLKHWTYIIPLTIIAFHEHIGIIKAIKGLQLCKVTGPCVKIPIYICLLKSIIVQSNNARSLFNIAHQDITMTHQNKLFNMSVSAWSTRTIIQDQSKVHYCTKLFHLGRGCSPSSKRSNNNSILPLRLLADIIKINIQFLSLNLYHSCVNNYFHIVFYKQVPLSIVSNTTKFTWQKISYSLINTVTLTLVILRPLKLSQAFSTPLHSISNSLNSILAQSFIQTKVSFYSLVYSFK